VANGVIQTSYDYAIQTTDPEQDNVKYQIDWGDNTTTITGLNESGANITVSHTWDTKGTYNVIKSRLLINLVQKVTWLLLQ